MTTFRSSTSSIRTWPSVKNFTQLNCSIASNHQIRRLFSYQNAFNLFLSDWFRLFTGISVKGYNQNWNDCIGFHSLGTISHSVYITPSSFQQKQVKSRWEEKKALHIPRVKLDHCNFGSIFEQKILQVSKNRKKFLSRQ